MRRAGGSGLAALDRSLQSSAQYSSLSDELTSSQVNELNAQLQVFSSSLRQFAQSHRKDIVKDAQFRHAFQQMCARIGVDPLGSSSKGLAVSRSGKLAGLWNDLLGLGDFQYELCIQIIDVCVSTRAVNGGLIEMSELVKTVNILRMGNTYQLSKEEAPGQITDNDILESIKLLKPLGSGYEAFKLNDDIIMIRSIPKELDVDSTYVIAAFSSATQELGKDAMGYTYLTEDHLLPESGNKGRWSRERARAVLQDMTLRDGLLWVDEEAHPARYYTLSVLDGIDI